METTFFYVLVIVINTFFVVSRCLDEGDEGPSIQTTTESVLHTKDDEIAQLTCAASGDPLPSIKWEKDGTIFRDDSPGVVIISWNNVTTIQSHLLVAVTSDDRRGKYTCVASNKKGKTRQSFVIEESQTNEKGLSDRDYIAIGLAIGITLFIFAVILYFLIRGKKRLKDEDLVTTSRFTVNGQDNDVVEDGTTDTDFVLHTFTSPPKIDAEPCS